MSQVETLNSLPWKFNLGDLVVCRVVAAFPGGGALPLVVIERYAHQCTGGVQLHYRCRGESRDGTLASTPIIMEIELEAYQAPPSAPAV